MRGLGARLSVQPAIAKPLPRRGPLVRVFGGLIALALYLLAHALAASAAELPASNIVGVVVLSKDATISGAPLLSGQNITPNNNIEVKDGAAELTTTDVRN